MLDKQTITASAYCCHFGSEMIQWKPVVHTLFKQKQALQHRLFQGACCDTFKSHGPSTDADSNYKSHNTVNILVGITPQGSISFVLNS